MLEELSKKNKKWLKMAFNLCQDYDYAQEMVQEMYLKIYDHHIKNPDKIIKDVYVWVVMYNILKDKYKNSQNYIQVNLESALHIAVEDGSVEFDDIQQMYLNRANEFRYLDRGLLQESYDTGLRAIADIINMSHYYVYKRLEKTRKLILREDYDELYNNKNIKHQKKKGKHKIK
tara:strand:+ start:2880 stop:3401 length:522 start_codon:yes stop_codon:yes gene_type:complete